MQSKPLLATLLAGVLWGAPSAVSAFEAMDCIGTEICDRDICTPSAMVYTLDFDWTNDGLSVAWGGAALLMSLEDPTASIEDRSGQLHYDGPDDSGLRLAFEGTAITLMLATGVPGMLHLATCTAREAA